MLSWGFDLEKSLLPIGQCDQLSFNTLLYTSPIDDLVVNFDDNTLSIRFNDYYISLYSNNVGTLIITIENPQDGVNKISTYAITRKLNGEYFTLVNHKNRNKIDDKYVETFTWRDSKNNLEIINT